MSTEQKINRWIRAKEVSVIGSNGEQLGVLLTRDAIRLASEQDLDLVEVAPNTTPPVCKIMDYGKYRYQQSKKHTKQKTIVLKEVRVRPQINEHDLQFKMKSIQKFLEQGNKAKVTMLFRGREIVHTANAKNLFTRITEEFSNISNIEQTFKIEGRRMTMVLAPK
ncbi:MAG: translation initiation factor IF-3 [Nitrospirae bacterium]|nr:translation initiation factor IF-3 [Nitrospirota bacterium]